MAHRPIALGGAAPTDQKLPLTPQLMAKASSHLSFPIATLLHIMGQTAALALMLRLLVGDDTRRRLGPLNLARTIEVTYNTIGAYVKGAMPIIPPAILIILLVTAVVCARSEDGAMVLVKNWCPIVWAMIASSYVYLIVVWNL